VNNPGAAAGGTITYSWSGAGLVSGGTTASATWSQGGDKTVTVTFTANGCVNTCVATVTVNTTKPDLTCTGDNITCIKTTATTHVTVNNPGDAAGGTITYSWSGAGLVSGGDTADATWSQGGNKTVTVTFTANGCTNTCTASVTVDVTKPPCSFTPANPTVAPGGTVQVCGPDGAFTYLWSTGETTRCVTVGAGCYTLKVTNAAGCFDTCHVCVHEIVGRCWLTGGGQSFDHDGHLHSYGGVVNPGCSPTAAGGGNWNDPDHP